MKKLLLGLVFALLIASLILVAAEEQVQFRLAEAYLEYKHSWLDIVFIQRRDRSEDWERLGVTLAIYPVNTGYAMSDEEFVDFMEDLNWVTHLLLQEDDDNVLFFFTIYNPQADTYPLALITLCDVPYDDFDDCEAFPAFFMSLKKDVIKWPRKMPQQK